MADARSFACISAVVALCSYPGFEFKVVLTGEGEIWMQIVCEDGINTDTGEPASWKGRKWKLSRFMTDTEIVQTCWAAVQRALMHEASELFRFNDASIFDRHLDVWRLAQVAATPNSRDGRHDGMEAV